MLDELRNLSIDRVGEEQMVALAAFAELLEAQYTKAAMEPPDWLGEKSTALKKEIASRRRDNLERSLKMAKGKLEALKTADEKRQDLAKLISDLEAKLQG